MAGGLKGESAGQLATRRARRPAASAAAAGQLSPLIMVGQLRMRNSLNSVMSWYLCWWWSRRSERSCNTEHSTVTGRRDPTAAASRQTLKPTHYGAVPFVNVQIEGGAAQQCMLLIV